MFLNYSSSITWSDDFNVLCKNDFLFFLNIDSHFVVKKEKVTGLLHVISNEITIDEYISTLPPKESIEFCQLADSFFYKKIIVNSTKKSLTPYDIDLIIDNIYKCKSITLQNSAYEIFISTRISYVDKVFFVSDHADSSILEHIVNGDSFILISISQQGCLISPIIDNIHLDYDCYRNSVLLNQPIRKWIENNYGTPIPVAKKNIAIDKNLINNILTILRERDINHTHCYFILNDQVKKNIIRHKPSCRCKHIPNKKHSKKNDIIKYRSDNGYRAIDTKSTLEKVNNSIGRIAGLITSIKEVNSDNSLPFKTYQTSFFRSIPLGSSIETYASEITSLGKGISSDQAKVSAICESLERYSAHFQGNELSIYSKAIDLDSNYLEPADLNPISVYQEKNMIDIHYPGKKAEEKGMTYSKYKDIEWYNCTSLISGEKVYVPLSYIFSGVERQIKFCSWNSNGCAAGNTLNEAIIQGFLEVVERDAVAIWWYNKVSLPNIDKNTISQSISSNFCNLLDKEWDWWVLDATNDLEIPVCIAVAKSKKNNRFLFGFGAHFEVEIAIQRAVTELCQLISVMDKNIAPFDFDKVHNESYLYPCDNIAKKKNTPLRFEHFEQAVTWIKKIVKSKDMDLIYIDYNRPEVPINTVKVIIPGMNHIWPQFNNKRLYQVPLDMKWHSDIKLERELNSQHLYL